MAAEQTPIWKTFSIQKDNPNEDIIVPDAAKQQISYQDTT